MPDGRIGIFDPAPVAPEMADLPPHARAQPSLRRLRKLACAGIRLLNTFKIKDVGGRDQPGHDDIKILPSEGWRSLARPSPA
jgi:hypothetical protein